MVDRVGQQLGHYRLLRVLGQGAFAQVYQAEHLYLDTTFSSGQIGVQVSEDSLPTEVVFRNAQVWNV